MTEAVTPPNPAGGGIPGGVPVRSTPDPTLLTIDALRREIAMQDSATQKGFKAMEKLNKERFHRLDEAMKRAELLRREQKNDTRHSGDAALEALRDATAKTERTMDGQISALTASLDSRFSGVEKSVTDLKESVTRLESRQQGQSDQRTESRQVAAGWYALIGAVGGVILVLLALYPYMRPAP